MKVLILSHFNAQYGPRIFLKAPESIVEDEIDQITSLMDLYEEGFFVHIFGGFKSANLIFEIPSKYARGNRELLLISILIDINSNINFDLSKELLEGFEKEFKKIDNAGEAFYPDSADQETHQLKLNKIKSLFQTFYESFPKESVIYDRKDAKILIYGLSQAGKTTIIKTRRKGISSPSLPTTSIDISRVLVNNISLVVYDTPGQLKFRELWKPYLKNQDGLIFVVDVADTENYDSAREILHNIALMPNMSKLPLLILFNKIDLEKPNIEDLIKNFRINKLGERPIRCFLTSALKDEGIQEAFNWFSTQISEQIFPKPKSDLAIIFSHWDEEVGVKVISFHPNEAFDDPEVIAIRCFSISQFIFGGEDFKRVSVILPFTHLKVKAAIYFDYVVDSSVRGGALPLSLVIFYDEKIPRAIIDHFHNYVFEKLALLKEDYRNRIYAKKILKKIQKKVIKDLKDLKPTIQALRIAELRYQALFKAARDAIIIIDRKSGIIVDANEQAERLLNQPLEDIISLHASQIEIKATNENFLRKILNKIENEESSLLEVNIKNPNQKIIPVEINANEVKMGGQNVVQCILRDITERKQAQEKLKESEMKYRLLFKNSPTLIILIDSKGVIIDCNPVLEIMLGYSKEDIINKKFARLEIIPPKYLLMLLECLKNVVKGEKLTFLDIKLRKKDGSFIWGNVQSSQARFNDEMCVQLLIQDISEQKESEMLKEKAQEALKESEEKFHEAYDQANFYKELFVHDINDLLYRIQDSAKTILAFLNSLGNLFEAENAKNLIKIIKEQTNEGKQLVYKIQKLSEVGEAKTPLESVEVMEVLQSVITKIEENFKNQKIRIKVKAPKKRQIVKANVWLFELFHNLIINSVKYNTDYKIKIEIYLSDIIKNGEDYLKIEFIDNGPGISEHQRKRIFKGGANQVRDMRGVLLGFLLIERIVDSLNGKIWVENKVDDDYSKGSKFIILLPKNVY
ncbi:MAG: PAS domain S-box protein [Candidatus Lokiarchaeota archaeon]|nr:PAS domain S-box protein [Candidatus Lokiarchaeota archaeon]MBD3340099.1 PAS domain S-box protein [Candidatus Lokiarchaeota archaeon]